MVLLNLFRFLVLGCTDVCMMPALFVMWQNRRHFEFFIGVFHLVISYIFNVCEAFHSDVFLRELQWHFISDILSVTYSLMLCVHLMGHTNEDVNIVLRYIAFACAWLAKTRDQWDNAVWEVLLIAFFVCGALYRIANPKTRPPIDWKHAKTALMYGGGSILYFCLFELEVIPEDPFAITKGILHALGGASFYYAWKAVPCRGTLKKKYDDDIPMFNNSSFR